MLWRSRLLGLSNTSNALRVESAETRAIPLDPASVTVSATTKQPPNPLLPLLLLLLLLLLLSLLLQAAVAVAAAVAAA